MKSYMMSIIGAVLICVFAEIILPDKWNKYIKILTGLIIISTIAAPIKDTFNFDISDFDTDISEFQTDADIYAADMIRRELEDNLENDIEQRILEEFGKSIDACVTISVNAENKIDGVSNINLNGDISEKIRARINEIYAPKEMSVNGF